MPPGLTYRERLLMAWTEARMLRERNHDVLTDDMVAGIATRWTVTGEDTSELVAELTAIAHGEWEGYADAPSRKEPK